MYLASASGSEDELCLYSRLWLIISGCSSRDDSNGSLVVVTLSLWIRIWIWNVTLGFQSWIVGVDLVESIDKRSIFGLEITINR